MSVIGQEIPEELLSEVSDLGERELAEAVQVLAESQWVIPRGSSDRREYVFKHPLTREVAYGSQLSQWRVRAHRKVAAAIERAYPEALEERAALLAHHCEAAGNTLVAAEWHARAAAWAEVASPADCIRHWRRVRHLTNDLEPSPEIARLAARARLAYSACPGGWESRPRRWPRSMPRRERTSSDSVRTSSMPEPSCTAARSRRAWRDFGRPVERPS